MNVHTILLALVSYREGTRGEAELKFLLFFSLQKRAFCRMYFKTNGVLLRILE
jgi:hypothetical protein